MKKAEILKSYKLDKLNNNTVFIQNEHFNFSYTAPGSIVKEEYRDQCRYFGGLQCNFSEGSEKYKNLENWVCELAERSLGIKQTKNEEDLDFVNWFMTNGELPKKSIHMESFLEMIIASKKFSELFESYRDN